jgi:methyl-accepting chemotaxis protein
MKIVAKTTTLFSRLRVGQQLYAAFAVLLVLTALVGGLAIRNLNVVHSQVDDLAGKWLQGVGHLAVTRAAVLESRDFEIKHSRVEDRSYHSEYEEKMTEAAKLVSSSMKAYESLAASDDERALLATFTKNWSAYQQAQQKVVALGRDKKRQDAADISDGMGSTAADETVGALDVLTKFNFSGGKAAAEQSQGVYTQATQSLFVLLGVALVLGVALAHLITRQLIRQLGCEPRVAAAVAQDVAGGNLTTRIDLRPGDSSSLMAHLKAMQASLAKVVGEVRQGSHGVAQASAEIAAGNNDLSARTEQQASALEETAASMEELGSTVRQNADNARQANQLALGASTVAVKGGEVVGQVVNTMKGINDSSRRIADIISVIDSIAFQTNILALNAAVEAARAGEQGRGFAVVAAEVRSLAQRSAEAAKEIKSLISTSVERVEQGTRLVDQAGVTMTEIVGAIQRVTDIMGEISSASTEQSAGVSQVGEAVTQMDKATQQNAALVEQSAAAAESLKVQAQQLVQSVAVFKLAAGDMHSATAAPPAATRAAAAPARAAPARAASAKAVSPPVAPAKHTSAKASAPVERRGPNRATNVARLPGHGAKAAAPVAPVVADARPTGTDEEWTTF